MKKRNFFLRIIFILALVSCQTEEAEITGPVSFSLLPVPLSSISSATPLGNLNPPGHCFPTDHIYIYLNGSSLVPVLAMANGTIRTVYYNSMFDDYRIEFNHTASCMSYFDHVKNLFPGIVEGADVVAGDYIGYGDPTVAALDIGVVDEDITRNFISPERYHEFTVHCGDPYTYFVAPIRSQLLSKNRRTVEPRGGKIDYDIDGTIAGNWFLEGIPTDHTSSGYTYGYGHLAFVYDKYNPTNIRIAAGGTLALAPFVYSVVGNSPAPGSVSLSSGAIKYEFISMSPAVLMVQMLESRRIRVEVFPGKTWSEVSVFTTAAKIYVR